MYLYDVHLVTYAIKTMLNYKWQRTVTATEK